MLHFFTDFGLDTVTERGGRVFPASGKAPEVFQALEQWVRDMGVSIVANTRVDALCIQEGHLTGVSCNGKVIECCALILAPGGASYPLTGSTGDGYAMAEQAGHRIVTVRPALVPIVTAGPEASRMEGLQLRNIQVCLFIDGKKGTRPSANWRSPILVSPDRSSSP